MKATTYLNCTNYYEIHTGSSGAIKGLYDTRSGINDIIFNLIYPTGTHYQLNQIYAPAIPLINVGRYSVSNGYFTGINALRVGYEQSGDFGLLFDFEYSGCQKTTTGISNILFSTADNPTGDLSGAFYIGINDANRLYLGTTQQYVPLAYELRTRNIFYVSLTSQEYVSYGIYDYLNNAFVSETVELNEAQDLINKLYLGNFLNNQSTLYTGFSGKINNIVFLGQDITNSQIGNCSDCLFVTGQTNTPNVTSLTIPTITGYVLSGVTGQVQTGTALITGYVYDATGRAINVLYQSGLFDLIQTGFLTTLLTGTGVINVTGNDIVTFYKDSVEIGRFNTFDIQFLCPFYSGDVIEIYGHNVHNPYVNYLLSNFEYPVSDNFIQLFGNGLAETLGVDYGVGRNLITGFEVDDLLGYDFYSGDSAIMPYSGFWARSRILMSGGSYFPPVPQFGEASGTMVTGAVSGQPISSKSNFYLNGQKLISGVHYKIWNNDIFGYPNLSGYVVEFYPSGSGILSDFTADVLYAPNGSGTGIGEIQDAELTMLETWDTNYHQYLICPTGTNYIINNITGFSEQVWINGIRQYENRHYVKLFSCNTFSSGVTSDSNADLLVYNNSNDYFNI